MGSALLMPHQDVLDLVLLEHGVVNVQYRASGIPEDMLHTLIDERLNDDLRTTQFHVGDPPSTPCPTANPQAKRRVNNIV